MAAAATWLVSIGLCFLLPGLVLRTVLMLRFSDVTPAGRRALHGRELLRQYRSLFPSSRLPLLMRGALLTGLLLLAAGICYEVSR